MQACLLTYQELNGSISISCVSVCVEWCRDCSWPLPQEKERVLLHYTINNYESLNWTEQNDFNLAKWCVMCFKPRLMMQDTNVLQRLAEAAVRPQALRNYFCLKCLMMAAHCTAQPSVSAANLQTSRFLVVKVLFFLPACCLPPVIGKINCGPVCLGVLCGTRSIF